MGTPKPLFAGQAALPVPTGVPSAMAGYTAMERAQALLDRCPRAPLQLPHSDPMRVLFDLLHESDVGEDEDHECASCWDKDKEIDDLQEEADDLEAKKTKLEEEIQSLGDACGLGLKATVEAIEQEIFQLRRDRSILKEIRQAFTVPLDANSDEFVQVLRERGARLLGGL